MSHQRCSQYAIVLQQPVKLLSDILFLSGICPGVVNHADGQHINGKLMLQVEI